MSSSILRIRNVLLIGILSFILFWFYGPDGHGAQTMKFENKIPLIDEILEQWKPHMGDAFQGYKNHCYRVYHFTRALEPNLTKDQLHELAIATAHHDIGIWSDKHTNGQSNVDYIDPSVARALQWIRQSTGKESAASSSTLQDAVRLIISEHHKITPYVEGKDEPRRPHVEAFRQADLIDVSLGVVRFGLSRSLIAAVKSNWPNEGFHWTLLGLGKQWFVEHPLSPPPFMKL